MIQFPFVIMSRGPRRFQVSSIQPLHHKVLQGSYMAPLVHGNSMLPPPVQSNLQRLRPTVEDFLYERLTFRKPHNKCLLLVRQTPNVTTVSS